MSYQYKNLEKEFSTLPFQKRRNLYHSRTLEAIKDVTFSSAFMSAEEKAARILDAIAFSLPHNVQTNEMDEEELEMYKRAFLRQAWELFENPKLTEQESLHGTLRLFAREHKFIMGEVFSLKQSDCTYSKVHHILARYQNFLNFDDDEMLKKINAKMRLSFSISSLTDLVQIKKGTHPCCKMEKRLTWKTNVGFLFNQFEVPSGHYASVESGEGKKIKDTFDWMYNESERESTTMGRAMEHHLYFTLKTMVSHNFDVVRLLTAHFDDENSSRKFGTIWQYVVLPNVFHLTEYEMPMRYQTSDNDTVHDPLPRHTQNGPIGNKRRRQPRSELKQSKRRNFKPVDIPPSYTQAHALANELKHNTYKLTRYCERPKSSHCQNDLAQALRIKFKEVPNHPAVQQAQVFYNKVGLN